MKLTDDMLRQSAVMARDAMLASPPEPEDCPAECSPQLRRLDRILRHQRRPVFYGAVRQAAACFLAVLALGGGWLAADRKARAPKPTYTLTFDGTTAICAVDSRGETLSSKISATVKLWDGGTCLKTWPDSSTGYLLFSETHSKDIKSGKSCKITVDCTIAGKSYPQLSASAVCRG